MPLTTRPAVTSRQGMMRLASNVSPVPGRPGAGPLPSAAAPNGLRSGSFRATGAATAGSVGASYHELVGAGLRQGEVEVAAVDGAAADHALDADVLHRAEALDVLHR